MRHKGFSSIVLLVLMAALFILASAGAYYYLSMIGKAPNQKTTLTQAIVTPTPGLGGVNPISDRSDSAILQSELEETTIASPDSDIQELETSASAL